MQEDGRIGLFANDMHIWALGHRLVEGALRERVLQKLRARK
jgi:hypothetical protein